MKMKKKTVRLSALLLSLVICASLLVSCGESKEKASTSLGEYELPAGVFRYIVINARLDTEAVYGENVWESESKDKVKAELEETVLSYAANFLTVYSLGEDYGFKPDNKELAYEAEDARENMINELGGEEEFLAGLEAEGLDEDTFRELTVNDGMIDLVFTAIVKSDEKYSDEAYLRSLFEGDGFIRVKQILIGDENADEDDLERAEGILARIRNGEDFDEISKEYNNDLFMFANEDGYYIMRGTRDRAFEEAAFALGIDEVSEVVKTDSGYSILKRYEKDPDYIEAHFDELTDEFYETLYTEAYEARYAEILGKLALPEDTDILAME